MAVLAEALRHDQSTQAEEGKRCDDENDGHPDEMSCVPQRLSHGTMTRRSQLSGRSATLYICKDLCVAEFSDM
jgi:hypothetical protein